MFVNSSVAETITFFGKPSLLEGGLTAEYYNDEYGSRHCSGQIGLCRYRDEPIVDMNNNPVSVDRRLRTTVGFNITNADGGDYFIGATGTGQTAVLKTGDTVYSGGGGSVNRVTINEGESGRVTVTYTPDPGYLGHHSKGSATTFEIHVRKNRDGKVSTSPDITITVFDDDDRYYIGQRNGHPYDGYQWQSSPYCGAGANGSC